MTTQNRQKSNANKKNKIISLLHSVFLKAYNYQLRLSLVSCEANYSMNVQQKGNKAECLHIY